MGTNDDLTEKCPGGQSSHLGLLKSTVRPEGQSRRFGLRRDVQSAERDEEWDVASDHLSDA